MALGAGANFLTVTELADTLVRETGMSFRTAHEIVSKAVKDLDGTYDSETMASSVEYIMAADHHEFVRPEKWLVRESLDAGHFVRVRKVPGGPALETLEPEIGRSRELLNTDTRWLKLETDRLDDASSRIRSATREILAEDKIGT
jgi:argininosuccinate lyase